MTTQINDILRVAARLKDVNQNDIVNVFHAKLITGAAPPSDSDTLDHMAEYMENIYTEIVGMIHSGADFYDINVFNVTQDRPYGSTPWPTLVSGSAATDPLPSQVSGLVRGNTGYSRNWARKFFGPLVEGHNTDQGFMSGTLVGDLASAGAQWISGVTVGDMTYYPYVWHASAGIYRRIISAVVHSVWSTIRRRRFGRGT